MDEVLRVYRRGIFLIMLKNHLPSGTEELLRSMPPVCDGWFLTLLGTARLPYEENSTNLSTCCEDW